MERTEPRTSVARVIRTALPSTVQVVAEFYLYVDLQLAGEAQALTLRRRWPFQCFPACDISGPCSIERLTRYECLQSGGESSKRFRTLEGPPPSFLSF